MAHNFGRSRPHSSRGRSRGRGRGRGRPAGRTGTLQPRTDFKTSRLRDVVDASDDANATSDEEIPLDERQQQDDDHTSSEDEADAQSYASLLKILNPMKDYSEPPSKKRKIEAIASENYEDSNRSTKNSLLLNEHADGGIVDADLEEQIEEDAVEAEEVDSESEEVILRDPFEQHYSNMEEQDIASAITAVNERQSKTAIISLGDDCKKTTSFFEAYKVPRLNFKSTKDLVLKRRLVEAGQNVLTPMTKEERDLTAEVFGYIDTIYGFRSVENASRIRDMACLHALNHIFKTRDRVLKNNAKLAHETSGESDLRDQGFTRPKVLFILPTKQACVRLVESMVRICEPDQQENKSRFLDTFSQEDGDLLENKPDDFRELFSGNNEEDFRVGLKFTRKTIKFFSGFYNSDIVLASPLGLMRTITTGGGAPKDEKKNHDSDFLSSIEIAIMDHANALEMQNWQHVEYVFSQLNLLPKESHGCDFSRARNWYLDGHAKHFRQTIIFSTYLTPSINALASTSLHNVAGRAKYVRTYRGAIESLPASLPMSLTQSFLRFASPSPLTDSDTRFNYFTSSVLPSLLRNKASSAKGTLLFVPAYVDFVRLRNHFSTSTLTTSLSFGTLSEYTSMRDAARARSHFASSRHSVLLYTERAHHYFRYRIRGVKRIIFYGVPENPVFWGELLTLLGLGLEDGQNDESVGANNHNKQGKGLVRAMFSKWDVMKMERIVGTERISRLVSEREGDVFDFV